jgi:hypothetical protein
LKLRRRGSGKIEARLFNQFGAEAASFVAFALDVHLRLPGNRNCHVLRRADLPCPVKPRRRDADDRKRNVVEVDLLADYARVATEPPLPVTIANIPRSITTLHL